MSCSLIRSHKAGAPLVQGVGERVAPCQDMLTRGLCSRLNARRCISRALSALSTPLPLEQLPPDVNPESGLCAEGFVRIGACSTPSKGLGAYAAAALASDVEVGRYHGEILSLGDLMER